MDKLLSEIKIKDVMTTSIVACHAEDSVLDVAEIMVKKDFDGLPVVDEKNKLVGMITTKELLDHHGEYLPTVVQILNNLEIYHSRDVPGVSDKLNVIKNLKVRSVMNQEPVYLSLTSNLQSAAEAFLLRKEDPLPVVDDFKTLIGIVSKYDVLKALTDNIQPIVPKSNITIEGEPTDLTQDLTENLKRDFVMVSRTRARFWYIAFFVFLALGILIALAVIIRIRIV